MTKGVDERIDEGVLRLFSYVEGMENDGIAKRFYAEECNGSRSVGSLRKRWIDTVKDCLTKQGLDVTQVRRMVKIGVHFVFVFYSGLTSICDPTVDHLVHIIEGSHV